MNRPGGISIVVAAMFMMTSAMLAYASQPDWTRSYSATPPSWVGSQLGLGLVACGDTVFVLDLANGDPTDTLVSPSTTINGALVRYDLDRFYIIGKRPTALQIELLIYSISSGTLIRALEWVRPGRFESGGGRVGISDDGAYLGVTLSGMYPSEDPRQPSSYFSSAYIWDVVGDSMKVAHNSRDGWSVHFLRSKPWVRVDASHAYDLKGDTLVTFGRALGLLSQTGQYHRPKAWLLIARTSDPTDDDYIIPHDNSLRRYNFETAEWVIGDHIVLGTPNSRDQPDDTTMKVIDISRDDTLLVCETPGTHLKQLSGFNDSSTVIGLCDDGTVRKWSLPTFDPEPGTRIFVTTYWPAVKQYQALGLPASVFPPDSNVVFLVDWGDGRVDPSVCHTYDDTGTYTAVLTAVRDGLVVDDVQIPLTVKEHVPIPLDGATWYTAVPGSRVYDIRFDPRSDRVIVVAGGGLSFGYVRMIDAERGSSITTLRGSGPARSLFLSGDTTTFILTHSSTSGSNNVGHQWATVQHFMVKIAPGQRLPEVVAEIGSDSWRWTRYTVPDWGYFNSQSSGSDKFLYHSWTTSYDVVRAYTALLTVSDRGEWSVTPIGEGTSLGIVSDACVPPGSDTVYLTSRDTYVADGTKLNATTSFQAFSTRTGERLDSTALGIEGEMTWVGHQHILVGRYLVDASVGEIVDTLPGHSARIVLPRGHAILGNDSLLLLIDVFKGDTLWTSSIPLVADALQFDIARSQLYVVYGREHIAALYVDPDLYATESKPMVREIDRKKREQIPVPYDRVVSYTYERSTGGFEFQAPPGFSESSGVVVGADVLGNLVPVRFTYRPMAGRVRVTAQNSLMPRTLYLFKAISSEGSTTIRAWIGSE